MSAVMLDGREVDVTFSIAKKTDGTNRLYYIGLYNKTAGNVGSKSQNVPQNSTIPTVNTTSIQPNTPPVNTNFLI